MNKIFNIKEEEIKSFVEESKYFEKDKIIDALSVAISDVPSIAENVCNYIDLLRLYMPEVVEPIRNIVINKDEKDSVGIVSRIIYGEYLGAKSLDKIVDPICKVLEGTEIKCTIPPVFKGVVEKSRFREIFYCYAIIQRFVFDKKECRLRLQEYNEEDIIEAMLIEESIRDIRMIIELCRFKKFFDVLYKNISRFKRRIEIISLIFVAYFNPSVNSKENSSLIEENSKRESNGKKFKIANEEEVYLTVYDLFIDEKEAMVSLLTDKNVKKYISKIGSEAYLRKFLGETYDEPIMPSIPFSEFNKNNASDFFTDFLKLTSPSPTHFLSYLEYFIERFYLNEKEQHDFIKMLNDFYRNNEPTLEIIKNKLVKFGIIKDISSFHK